MDQKRKKMMKRLDYFMHMRPLFDVQSLFSDGTDNFVTPMEPEPGDKVKIRFRTKKDNVDFVFFISGSLKKRMEIESSDSGFDYYATEITVGKEPVYYYFEIQAGRTRCFYTKPGVSRNLNQSRLFCLAPGFSTPDWAKGAVMYQIFTERFCNGDPSNDVLDGEYLYIGKPVNRVTDWDKLPASDGTREFYGGDLQGIWDKLDYLQELGVEVLYLNPVFVSPSNHKYDTQDYDYVDPHIGVIVSDEGDLLPSCGYPSGSESGDFAAGCFGTKSFEEGSSAGKSSAQHTGRPVIELSNRDATRYISRVTDHRNLEASNAFFAKLVEEIHRRGMRVILDGVFNHCGSFNKWMDRERIYENRPGYEKGAYVSADSPYRSFFRFNNEHEWPCNPYYEGWWGYDTLPKLNYEGSQELEDYILRIAAKWVSPPYNVDGWRLDVAADLGFSPEYNHQFWRKFRDVVKAANPDAIILAEHYEDASAWLGGDQWDTIMNYRAFMEPMTWFFTGMEKHSDEYREDLRGDAKSFQKSMQQGMTEFLTPSLQTAMNELSNHDHSRFLTRTSGTVGRVEKLGAKAANEGVRPEIMREAVVMQMTWPGAPTIYYGDEAGVCGFTDPDNRRTYPWGHEDRQMLEFHRRAIAMHRRYPVLSHGSLCFLGGEKNWLAYGRFSRESQMVIVFNNSEERMDLTVPVKPAGILHDQILVRIFVTTREGFSEDEAAYPLIGGELKIVLSGTSAAVLEARPRLA
ncbi:MAG: alpha amylase N-terminal ig-like domain-containing protein [Lachnospiraceae bacterium]|nr:alpha amylase N-terminal ig-like domain-containing protein [Lachnospiraceae bacterium]